VLSDVTGVQDRVEVAVGDVSTISKKLRASCSVHALRLVRPAR